MLNAHHDENGFVGITADIQMLLVVIGSFGISAVITLIELSLVEMIVQEFAVTEVKVNLHPFLGEGYRPEPVGTHMNLWDRLGIRTLDERTAGQQIVTNNLWHLPAARFQEERLPGEVDITLLKIDLMVSMQGTDGINSS